MNLKVQLLILQQHCSAALQTLEQKSNTYLLYSFSHYSNLSNCMQNQQDKRVISCNHRLLLSLGKKKRLLSPYLQISHSLGNLCHQPLGFLR